MKRFIVTKFDNSDNKPHVVGIGNGLDASIEFVKSEIESWVDEHTDIDDAEVMCDMDNMHAQRVVNGKIDCMCEWNIEEVEIPEM